MSPSIYTSPVILSIRIRSRPASTGSVLIGFALLLLLGPSPGLMAEEIKGRVQMTDFCSPTVSPAVVYLEYVGAGTGSGPIAAAASGSPATVSQSGLQFVPRVRAVALGEAVQLANRDSEAHRVRLEGDERRSSWMIPPGQTQEFRPERPGVLRLECGIHLHMRGALIVSPTRWFQVCSPRGDFRLEGVPPGRYVLVAWHEMGDATRRPIVISAGKPLEVPQIDLFGEMSLGTLVRKEIQTAMPVIAPVRPWNQPLDAISVLLAAARDELSGPGDARKAQRLLEDAYWGEFEASDLESAVRQHLGSARSASLVRQFGRVRRTLQDVAEKRAAPAALTDESRSLLIALGDSVRELNERGVVSNAGMASTRPDTSPARQAASSPALALQTLKRDLHRVQYHADRNIPEDAAASLLSVFQSAFVPLRDGVAGKDPVYARRLDRDFHRLRGELAWGLKGDDLVDRLEELAAGMDEELSRLAAPAGGLDIRVPRSSALATLAEGWPAALAVVVLASLVAGSGRPASRRETSAGRVAAVLFLSAIAGAAIGIAIEVVPGLTTGVLVHALTGWMELAAAVALVLAARRLGRGVPVPGPADEHESAGPRDRTRGPDGPLLCASSLVVVLATAGVGRVLFAMLRAHRGSPLGVLGVLAGGLLALAALALLVVLGLRAVRALAGKTVVAMGVFALFVLSAVLAGKGVFHLQCAGTLDATPLGWLLPGDPLPGLCPSLEGFVLQAALLVAGLWSASRLRKTTAGERDSSTDGQNFLLTSAGRSTAGAPPGVGEFGMNTEASMENRASPRPARSSVGKWVVLALLPVVGVAVLLVAGPLGRWPASGSKEREAIAQGRELLKKGKIRQALATVSGLPEDGPWKADLLALRGLALSALDQIEPSRQALEQSLALDPKQPMVAKVLAAIYFSRRESVKAIEYLDRAAKLDPGDFRPWYAMGEAFVRLAQPEEAATSFRHALDRRRDHYESKVGLASVLVATKPPEESAQLIGELLRLRPEDPKVQLLAAWHERALGHGDRALAHAHRAIELDPAQAEAVSLRAQLRRGAGDTAGALADAERAVELDPNNLSGLSLLAQLQAASGQAERSQQTLARHRKAVGRSEKIQNLSAEIQKNPADPARWKLGDVAAEGGLNELARQSYLAALAIDPRCPQAAQGLRALGDRGQGSGDPLAASPSLSPSTGP